MPDAEGSLELDLIAAALRADAANLVTFVEALAAKLEEAVPGLVAVERGRGGLRGRRRVQKLAVDAGGERLELVPHRDGIEARRARVSGGIVLKTEPIDMDEWMHGVSAALAREAARNGRARAALERLLMA
jgi:hypothetical protein